MSTPPPPHGPGDVPAAASGPVPAPRTPSNRTGPWRWPPSGALAAVTAGIMVIGAGAIVVAVARSGNDSTSERPPVSSVAPSSAASTTSTSTSTTTSTTAPASTTSTPSSAPAVQPTTRPQTSAPTTAAPDDALDLGAGVHLHVPTGWAPVSGPDDPLTISDGSIWYSPLVLQRGPGEGPQPVMQDAIDVIDGANAAVSYSPVTFQRTVSGTVPADEYALVYSAIGADGARLSGAIHTFVRGDGLVLVVDTWNAGDAWPDEIVVPSDISGPLERSLTSAPKLGPAETLPVVGPFRVTSVHPLVSPHGLAGFTVPPGFEIWTPTVDDADLGVAGATNGSTELVALALPARDSVEEVFAEVTADLDDRYPGLVIDPPTAQASRDGTDRLGAGFAGTLGGRPIAGGLDVWLVDGATAYAFAYTYYVDIEMDGANPDPVATQFAYSAFADSF